MFRREYLSKYCLNGGTVAYDRFGFHTLDNTDMVVLHSSSKGNQTKYRKGSL